ncbi:MAG TPA: winged helix-turn-helix domain-containing protein [Planctomycetota bacterium]|nr:winged helix-turn-helix domain-containing protein [Planctomycetota bacterium]
MERVTIDGRSLPAKIGELAGRVWRQLRAHGAQSPRDIAHAIGRSEMEVHQALGWLAREDKLRMMPDMKVALVDHEMSVTM